MAYHNTGHASCSDVRVNCYDGINALASNDVYISRTAHLTSRRCILNIYSTDILTEYFKHAAHSPFFSPPSRCRLFHNAIFFVSRNIHILNTGCAKILKKCRHQRVNIADWRHTVTLQRNKGSTLSKDRGFSLRSLCIQTGKSIKHGTVCPCPLGH